MTIPNNAPSQDPIPFKGMVTGSEFARMQRLVAPWWASKPVTTLCILFLGVYLEGWIAGLVIALPVAIAAYALPTLISRLQWRRSAVLQQEINGSIGVAGVGWNTALTTASFPWPKIVKVRQHAEMLLLFYGGAGAFFIPRRFFSTDAAWQGACALAARCHKDAKA